MDGQIREIEYGMKLDRYKTHDIEVVIDRLEVKDNDTTQRRLSESIQTAMRHGNGILMILVEENEIPRYFSRNLMCPTTGISYPLPEPNTFSFNSPKGMCPHCNGLGTVQEVTLKKLIPDMSLSIKQGAITAIGAEKKTWIFQ